MSIYLPAAPQSGTTGTTTGTMNRIFPVVFLVLAASSFLLIGLDRVNEAVDPAFEDTGSYLEGALAIQENGGISNFINLCLNGDFTIEPQHPLYLLLLSPFASRDLSFFPKAQLLSLAIGLLVLISLFFIARKLFNQHVSFIATALLAFNASFLERSSVVACETLLMLCVLLTWYCVVRGLDQQKYWLLAGLAGGLAFMTKATGIFTIPMFVLSNMLICRLNMFRNKYFWSFFVFFVLASSPLIVRNIVVYQSPLYEGVNSNVAWLDSYAELAEPKYELLINWPDHTYTATNLPTMRTYLASHSVATVVRRATTGVLQEFGLVLNSMYTVVLPRGQRYAAMLAFVLFLVGLIKDQDSRRRTCTIITILAFFGPSAWYFQIIPDIRFITPLIPLLCVYCGLGCVEVIRYIDETIPRAFPRHPILHATPYVLATGLVVASGYLAVAQAAHPLLHSVELTDDQNELFGWLRDNVREDDIVVMGPTNHYWGYLWYAKFKGSLRPTPANVSPAQKNLEAFSEYLKRQRVSVIIVHKENYARADVLGEYFDYDDVDGLVERKPMKEWKPVYSSSKKPTAFRIYRL